ncbi:hypothetical protein ALO68_102083 [Pseudomonas syringae pv. helianthi]|uniref:Uncharacterized protein n=1 Tax=Pseudomonas syringae pv. helianthi TaxID=251654 RepID=A0A0P9RFW1_9PSED|nr:hypothetical protein ALO68_102083 [Pseudomonas syringae pv. helianthi]RMW13901.1 hypothetical protein ALO98_101623 [Pseudomonas syringae pv. tagetis]RMW20745.1 hypothetical protein ALO97_101809 [Pseudomonas syringae pv. tagetis]
MLRTVYNAEHSNAGTQSIGTAVKELSRRSDSHAPRHKSNTGYFRCLNSFALAASMDRGTMVRLSNRIS